MVLAKVMQPFGGAGGVTHRVGEVLKLDTHSHLITARYVQEVDADSAVAVCENCGRMFAASNGEGSEFLEAHLRDDGCKPEKAKVGGKA